MTAKEKVRQLSRIITDKLIPLIDRDYVLLDLPYHSNLGDTLIWQGEIEFLKSVPYKCRHSTWHSGNFQKNINSDSLILLHGGGNFGDIWPRHQIFRKMVLDAYPENKAIIFPQTVFYSDKRKMEEDAIFFSKHPNVIICARDKHSFETLNYFFPNTSSLLVPDMAFCMDIGQYKRANILSETLFVKREDKEMNNKMDYHQVPCDAHVSDWLFLEKSEEYARLRDIVRWATKFDCRLGTDWKHKWLDLYWYHVLRPLNVKTAIRFIDQYKHIYTTRMHAAILSVILGKTDVTLFDNTYGKSSSFYNTWLRDVDGLKLIISK